MHTSQDTCKSYIGWTNKPMMERWKVHVKWSLKDSPLLFHQALKKHGTDRWDHEVLAECSTSDEAKRLEIIMIERYQTFVGDGHGYNMTRGGDGLGAGSDHPWFGCHHTEEAKERDRLAHLGDKNWMHRHKGPNCPTRVKRTPEDRKRISEAMQSRSPEEIERWKESLRLGHAKPESHQKHVEAGKKMWADPEKRKQLQASLKIANSNPETVQKIKEKKFKPVDQFTKEGEFIASYRSASEACEKTGVNNIGACCNGRLKSAGGFVWRFKK